jgi:uncharacterized membrane protein (TIGR02234 family)
VSDLTPAPTGPTRGNGPAEGSTVSAPADALPARGAGLPGGGARSSSSGDPGAGDAASTPAGPVPSSGDATADVAGSGSGGGDAPARTPASGTGVSGGGDGPDPGGSSPAPGATGAGAGRRGMGVVAGLCAAGGGLALSGAGQVWLRVVAERAAPLPDVTLELTGRDLDPLVTGLGVVGLAGVVGLLATRSWGRLAVAAVIALSGLGVLVASVRRLGVPGPDRLRELLEDSGRAGGVTADAAVTGTGGPGWALVAAAGGLLLLAGGVLALLRARTWPTMSARYESPRARPAARPTTTAAVWDAMDRGDDPTA